MNYTIKQVSEMTGLSIPTIRYYDKERLLPDLQRKESGYRIFPSCFCSRKYSGAPWSR